MTAVIFQKTNKNCRYLHLKHVPLKLIPISIISFNYSTVFPLSKKNHKKMEELLKKKHNKNDEQSCKKSFKKNVPFEKNKRYI